MKTHLSVERINDKSGIHKTCFPILFTIDLGCKKLAAIVPYGSSHATSLSRHIAFQRRRTVDHAPPINKRQTALTAGFVGYLLYQKTILHAVPELLCCGEDTLDQNRG